MEGRLLPLGWWHFLTKGKRIDRVRVGFLGVKPEYQHTGVAAKLYVEHFNAAAVRPQKGGEMGWILETNTPMNRGMEAMGGRVVKRYRVYERLLSSGRRRPLHFAEVSEPSTTPRGEDALDPRGPRARCGTPRRCDRRCSCSTPADRRAAQRALRSALRLRPGRSPLPRRSRPAGSSPARRSSVSRTAARPIAALVRGCEAPAARGGGRRRGPRAAADRRQLARCWWTCTCSAALARALSAGLSAAVELRVEVSPGGPVSPAAAQAAWTACCAAAAGCSSGCCTTASSRCVVRVAQTAPRAGAVRRPAPSRRAAAEHGIERMRFALGVDEDLRVLPCGDSRRPADRRARCGGGHGCGSAGAPSRSRRSLGRSASS